MKSLSFILVSFFCVLSVQAASQEPYGGAGIGAGAAEESVFIDDRSDSSSVWSDGSGAKRLYRGAPAVSRKRLKKDSVKVINPLTPRSRVILCKSAPTIKKFSDHVLAQAENEDAIRACFRLYPGNKSATHLATSDIGKNIFTYIEKFLGKYKQLCLFGLYRNEKAQSRYRGSVSLSMFIPIYQNPMNSRVSDTPIAYVACNAWPQWDGSFRVCPRTVYPWYYTKYMVDQEPDVVSDSGYKTNVSAFLKRADKLCGRMDIKEYFEKHAAGKRGDRAESRSDYRADEDVSRVIGLNQGGNPVTASAGDIASDYLSWRRTASSDEVAPHDDEWVSVESRRSKRKRKRG